MIVAAGMNDLSAYQRAHGRGPQLRHVQAERVEQHRQTHHVLQHGSFVQLGHHCKFFNETLLLKLSVSRGTYLY